MTIAAVEVKKTRNEGPVTILFTDGSEEPSKRIPENVVELVVKAKSGETKSFDLGKFEEATIRQLVAFGLASRITTFVRNTADDNGDNVIECASRVYEQLASGAFYTRGTGTGGKQASKFDLQGWKDTMRAYMKRTDQHASDADIENFGDKLMALTPPERQKKLLGMGKNPVIKAIRAEMALKAAKKAGTTQLSIADLF